MTTANDILKIAKSQLGIKEIPAGSNKVKYNTEYYGKVVSGANYAWCCAFVWWVFKHAGASKLFYDGRKCAYCPSVGDWGYRNKMTVSKSKGKPGDIVLFDWNKNGNSDHIGIIEKKNSDGTYTCIEGNTSLTSNDNGGKVMRRIRSQYWINLIIRPKYDKDPNETTSKPVSTTSKKTTIIKNVQKIIGTKADGSFGPKSKAAWGDRAVRKGTKSTLAKYCQQMLIYKGYSCGRYGADGSIGKDSVAAIKRFQKAKGLTQDGIIGKITAAALFK